MDATSNPIGNAAKKIIETLGFGPGSVKAKEDAARRDKIADALAEAGAEPQHVDAARVAMTIQAADAKSKGGKKKGTMIRIDAAS